MSVKAEELTQYVDQKVILTKNLKEPDADGNGAVEIEGTVEAANPFGVMIKPKGRVNAEIVELDDIEEVRFAPQKLTAIKQKDLLPIVFGNVRKHLAERHGVSMKWINETDEETAHKYHSELDHSDLGHRHVEKKAEENTENAAEDA